MSGENDFKIVVIGSGAVGKTALTVRLVTQNFLKVYDPTIEDNYNKILPIDGVTANLDILDTAGQDEYNQMQDQWMRDGKGFLIVYSIDNMSSFMDVKKYKSKIARIQGNEEYVIVLVGNKCDLENREVSREKGEELAREWGCSFFETSAKDKINHEECFFQVVREIRQLNAKAKSRNASKSEKKSFKCIIL